MSRKVGTTFSKLIYWEKLDLCKFAKDPNSLSFIKDILISVNRSFQGIIHQCPYTEIQLVNYTVSFYNQFDLKKAMMPNGKLQVQIRIHNNRDKNIFFLSYSWTRNVIVIN